MLTIPMWASLPDDSCHWILPFNAAAFWVPQHHSRWALSPSHTSVSGPIFQGSFLKTHKRILCPAETPANRSYSTLEQGGLELHGSTYIQIFSTNTCTVFNPWLGQWMWRTNYMHPPIPFLQSNWVQWILISTGVLEPVLRGHWGTT